MKWRCRQFLVHPSDLAVGNCHPPRLFAIGNDCQVACAVSHPKLIKLKEILLEHLQNAEKEGRHSWYDFYSISLLSSSRSDPRHQKVKPSSVKPIITLWCQLVWVKKDLTLFAISIWSSATTFTGLLNASSSDAAVMVGNGTDELSC